MIIFKKIKSIIIYGCGGHAKVVADIIEKNKLFRITGFINDDPNFEKYFLGYPVLGDKKILQKKEMRKHHVIIAIGNNKIRQNLFEKLIELRYQSITAIHPKAIIGSRVKIDTGTVVMAGVVINPGTKIGKNVIINTGATIDHDNLIENGAHIAPGVHLSGAVKIGELSWIGTGANIKEYICIGSNTIIGMGASVIKDVPDNVVYAGIPAKFLKNNN